MKKMKIYVNIKQIGKRKNKIDKKEYEISGKIETVKDLLIEFVTINVKEFNEGLTENDVVPYLTDEKINDLSDAGKISFGVDYNGKKDLQGFCKWRGTG